MGALGEFCCLGSHRVLPVAEIIPFSLGMFSLVGIENG